jgi:hypothetical protein
VPSVSSPGRGASLRSVEDPHDELPGAEVQDEALQLPAHAVELLIGSRGCRYLALMFSLYALSPLFCLSSLSLWNSSAKSIYTLYLASYFPLE